ncbi:NAD dependent epimerase/dehydratase family protein [Elsinoe ampelina]|uniref:NAD dependent epimerase/dehydratase family protein n=1 Tax=Elsinoe ampelina TaxID=302913 RepID=A0A6A6GFR6_9PEZI|nr:NAD dependent epimerase/dehydratase family protein [Elsinoe ampelina]
MAAPTAATKRIVVCGGNGFLGSRICKAATARGWDVTSISRSGEPKWETVTSSVEPPPWSQKVKWHAANVLQPSQYRDVLKGADAVVHSMGILLEADYKGVLTGKESIVGGLQKAFSKTKKGTANPLERQGDEDLEPLEEGGQITYEVMNRDSAILLAHEASKVSVPVFGYVSAAAGTPILPGRYITTKREAEDTLVTKFPQTRSFFVRPGFLFDSSRGFTIPIAAFGSVASMANSLVGGLLSGPLGAAVAKPQKADTVAEAIVEAIADDEIRGPVEIPKIDELANREWRRGML